jgi:hypothetical protein
MANATVTNIYFRYNPATRTAEIVADGKVIEETSNLADVPVRLQFHRAEAAKNSGQSFVEVKAYRKHNRRGGR